VADREFKIKITTTADTAGARETKESLDQTSEGALKFNEHGRDMHRVLHQLNEIAPGLGTVLKAVFNPAALGMVGMMIAVQGLTRLLDKLKEKMAEQSGAAAALFKEQVMATIKAAESAEDYVQSINKAGSAVDKLKTKEEQELAVLKAIEEGRKKIFEAQEATEKAGAAGDPLKLAEIERRYGHKKSGEELAMEQAEIDELKRNEAREKALLAEARAKADAAEKAKEAGAPGLSGYSAAKSYLQTPGSDPKNFSYYPSSSAESFQAQQLEAAGQLALLQQRWAAAAETVAHYDKAQENLAKAAEAALAEYNKAKEQSKKTQEEIDTRTAVQGIHQQTASALTDEQAKQLAANAGINNLGPGGTARARTISDVIASSEALAHGDKISDAQAKQLAAVFKAVEATTKSHEEAVRLFQEMRDAHVDAATKFKDLFNDLKGIRSQIKSLNTNSS
jgi:hypothetical protein